MAHRGVGLAEYPPSASCT